jgi:D-glycero-alpha-D-manno-heptose-7-phosphate kinase
MALMNEYPVPQRIVNAVAPVRICDIGGWTDTWFAEHGKVFHIAVHPGLEIQVRVHPAGALPEAVVLDVHNYGERYAFPLGDGPGRHPLLEAAIDEMGLPDDVSVEISVFSKMPAGSSTGTSASATVALMGALDALTPGRLTPGELAYAAHRVETKRLGIESGIQDQLCAVYGGINFIEITRYPHVKMTPLAVANATQRELEPRLLLVILRRRHVSSTLHERVIARLAGEGPDAPPLNELRHAAQEARDAYCQADLCALGRAMIKNTSAQRQLHSDLICRDAEAVIDVAAANGALGWKVNGAGGDGGSLSLLCGADVGARRSLERALRSANPSVEAIPIGLSHGGLRVWDGEA